MSKRFSLVVLALSLCMCLAHAQQKPSFDAERLSPKGREAYQKLLTAGLFAVGGVGVGGETSENELAMYDLLDDKEAVEALKSLVRAGTMEGGLYGLLGLSITNIEAFNQSVDAYKARKEFPVGKLFEDLTDKNIVRDGMAVTQSGCIIYGQDRLTLVREIQSGHYDKLLRRKISTTH